MNPVDGSGPPARAAARRPGRIVDKADFGRLLATRPRLRSAHFAIHHVAQASLPPEHQGANPPHAMLSTAPAPVCPQPVDDLPGEVRLGCMVPKRHARRAVTRNLIKRQARAAFADHSAPLAGGLWLVRLMAPFPRSEFVSAASTPLARAVRGELDALLRRAAG